MVRFRQKEYTQWDETDALKRMKDSDILAQKKKTNSSLNRQVLTSTLTGVGAGAGAGAISGLLKKGASASKRSKAGAVVGGLVGLATSMAATQDKRNENQFYNDRLRYAQRHALRRERADWKNNNINREGYTY